VTSVFNGTNGLPKSSDDLSWPNYGINPTNLTHNRVVRRWEGLKGSL